jgi:tetratricopeptide (TPR) repeat protein
MTMALTFNCEFDKALYHAEKALEIDVAANVLWGISVVKTYIAGWIYSFQGKIDLSHETSSEALRISKGSGDIHSKALAHTTHGWSYYYKGSMQEAKEHLLNGANLSERINHLIFSGRAHYGLGMTYLDMGEYKIAQKHYERAISIYQDANFWLDWVNYWKMKLILAKAMNNEKDINLNEVFPYYEDNKEKRLEGSMQSCIGEILLNLDDQHISEAEDWIKKAIESHRKYGMMWYLAKDYVLYADLFKRKDDLQKARENLSKSIEIFKECGADGWVEKYEKELASL